MLTKNFLINYLIIVLVIIGIFVGGMFTGAWVKEEHTRAQRVKQLKLIITTEGITDKDYHASVFELVEISR